MEPKKSDAMEVIFNWELPKEICEDFRDFISNIKIRKLMNVQRNETQHDVIQEDAGWFSVF